MGRIAFLGISRLDWRMRNATCSSPRPWSNEEKISLEVLLRLVEAEAVLEAGEGYGAEGCVGERPQGREQPGLRRETRGVGHPRRHGPRDAVGGELLGKLRPGPGARAHKREKHAPAVSSFIRFNEARKGGMIALELETGETKNKQVASHRCFLG